MIGQSVLKCGDHGRRVKQVQHSLAALGYEVGPIDGRFGLVTEEAVESFQRDFQLPADGVVGQRTALLLGSGVQAKFLIHRVCPAETLRGIAQTYALSSRVIAQINNLSDLRVTPGQMLRIPKRQLTGFCSLEPQPTDSLFRHGERLDTVVTAGLTLTPQGGLQGELLLREDLRSWTVAHQIGLWLAVELPQDQSELENLLFPRTELKKSVLELARKTRSQAAGGVVILVPQTVLARHRFALNRLFKWLAKAAPNMPLAAALPLPTSSRLALVDYQHYARMCRWLYLYPTASLDELSSAIRQLLKQVPCWQLLMGLAPSPSDRQLKQKISLITKYNLGGSWISNFGREGESFWASLREEFLSGDINPKAGS